MGDDLELWRRIADFDFDGGADQGYFVEKLAYEQGWSRPFAERVVGEYRRFLYLTCTAGHVVVPSDEVDMAWHQHLLDTEQYWGVLCKAVLKQPLHHRPSKGGRADGVDHVELYERSLQTYAETFGAAPPDDVWPQASRRFCRGSAHRRVALAHNWIVPKRRVRIVAGSAAGLLALPALVAWTHPSGASSIALGNNAFGWSDAEVVVALVVAGAIAVAIAFALRHVLLGKASEAEAANVVLNPYEAAVLNTNTHRAVNVAVAALVRDRAIGIDERALTAKNRRYRLVRTGPLPSRALSLERAVYAEVTKSPGGAMVSEVHDRMRPHCKRILDSLRERDLLRRHGYVVRRCVIAGPVIPVCALCAVGAWTTGYTASGFLVLLIAVLVITAVVASGPPPQLTDGGHDALEVIREKHAPVDVIDDDDDVADGRELSWVMALQGVGVLAGSMSVLAKAITAPASDGGGGRGVKSAGCGGGIQYSPGRGCGGGGSFGGGCSTGCGGGCGGGG